MAARHLEDLDSAMSRARPAEESATSSPDHGQTMAARHLEDLDSAMSRARPAEESATPRLRGTAMTAARWPS